MAFRCRTHLMYFSIVILLCSFAYSVPVLWNSSSENWLEFYKKYCGRVCKRGSVVSVSSFWSRTPSCFECDCDATCIIYETCCPSFDSTIDVDFNQTSSLSLSETSQARKLPSPDRFSCRAFPGSDKYFYVISDCSPEYLHNIEQEQSNRSVEHVDSTKHPENSVSKWCVESNTDTFDHVTPYIDLQYGITFKNVFCAMCNGYLIDNNSTFINDRTNVEGNIHPTIVDNATSPVVGTVSAWTLTVSCYHYQNLFHITSDLELFKSALKLGKKQCDIVYTQPNIKTRAKTCDPTFHRVTEATCSSSRSSLQGHCLELKHKFLLVRGGQTLFCYMCNNKLLSVNEGFPGFLEGGIGCIGGSLVGGSLYEDSPRPHLSLLLGASKPDLHITSRAVVSCTHLNEWPSSEGGCEPALCTAGKLAEDDGLCSTAIKKIRSLGYKLLLVLIPNSLEFWVTEADVKHLAQIIYNDLSETASEIQSEVKVKVLSRSRDPRKLFIQRVIVTARLISNSNDTRDEFESKVLRLVREAWVIQTEDNRTVNLITTVLGADLAPFLPDEDKQPVKQHRWKANIFRNKHCVMSHDTNTNFTYITHNSSNVERFYITRCSKDGINYDQWHHQDKFVDITNSLFCQFVAINFTNISFNGSSIVVNFSYNNRDFTLTSTTNISIVSHEIRICFDFFKNLTEPPLTEFGDNQTNYYLRLGTFYLEIICSFLSAACLLASFVTYCLFPVLRTLPGRNNMCLIASLALAHIFLFITVEFGLSRQLNQHYCLMHAILVHYFWLATFMWMSACCIHMYRVFTCQSTKFINTSCDGRRHLHYCIFAFGSPVCIIAIYVLVCLHITSGSSNGYNNTYCFLDVTMSILTTLLSLVAPLCLTILTNGVLFVLTIREIVQVTRLRRPTVDGKGVMTYVKLSTLTGLSYIVCGAALHLNIPMVDLLAAPAMCLQGVFIFMSFICNKRVGNMYCELLRQPRDLSQSSSMSKRTAVTDIASSEHLSSL